MTGRPDVWMPLYIGDYIAATGHLSAAEHGAYLLLLMHYWRSAAPLPADDEKLARIARMSPKEWRAAKDVISPFFQVDGGRWHHKRVHEELTKAEARCRSNRQRTAAATEARRASAGAREHRGDENRDVDRYDQRELARYDGKSPSPSPSPPDLSSSPNPPSLSVGPAQAPAKRVMGTRVPDEWPLTERLRAMAVQIRQEAGLPTINVELEHVKFMDYWRAKAGRDGTKCDWDATWRNWIRNARGAGAGQPRRSMGDVARDWLAGAGCADRPDVIEGTVTEVGAEGTSLGAGASDHERRLRDQ